MTTPERLFTLEEVARHLGLSVRTIKTFVATGKLQVLRFGRAARVTPEEFARFLCEGTESARTVRHAAKKAASAPAELDRKAIFELALETAKGKGRGPRK